eukprot:TRINITY_DN214_c0_g2_i1.p1 TRINITY_DN214_c0_g2~~TRINITY_DN214_c0_g2_i1.p1  ORF type:complete len:335 (-),score=50.94 TRINITY_DN214_c0_g2_i1:900-1904(-)
MISTVFALSLLAFSANAKDFSLSLEPFSGLRICVPYTVQIVTSNTKSSKQYALEISADQQVYNALVAEVNEADELELTSDGDFETSNPIKVVMKLPYNKLKSVVAQGFGDVLISGAFESEDLSVVSGGTKALYAPDLIVTKTLEVENQGVGDVVLGGDLSGDIKVTQSGVAEVYLTDVSGDVQFSSNGISTLGIDTASNSVTITGNSLGGLSEVQYTGGTCTISSLFQLSSPCKKVSSLSIPTESTKIYWTCGIKVEGKSTCGASTGASTVVSDGVGFSSASAVSGTGGSVFSSSSSSSGPGGVTTVTVQGDNAAAVAISESECSAKKSDLKIE